MNDLLTRTMMLERQKKLKETVLDEIWWDKIDYMFSFTALIYDVLRKTNIDIACLHLVFEM